MSPRFHSIPTTNVQTNDQTTDCVEDRATGLIWETKTRTRGLRNRHHKYSWHITNNRVNGGFAGYKNGGKCTGTPCDTQGYINAVNQSRLCSLSNWRLPTREELGSLVNFGIQYPGPVIDQSAFPNTVAQFYWSASPDANDPDSAWGVGFAFGYDYAYFKSDAAQVRLVHDNPPSESSISAAGPAVAGQRCPESMSRTSPAGRFILQQNGTATDRKTGLMWMRCLVGQRWNNGNCQGDPISVDLQTAYSRTNATSYADNHDWRLPDIHELGSITELGCETPAINLSVFPGSKPANVWSSTPFINDPSRRWLVQFKYGENHIDKSTIQAQVRLVRRVSQ